MRHHWNRKDLRLVTRGLLQFSPEQAQLLLAHVSERIKQKQELPSVF